MSKSTGNTPSLLSIARRSSSAKDESSDDDRAFLLPSNSSSFNLVDDAEVINSSRTHRNGSESKNRKSRRHESSRKSSSCHSRHTSTSTVGSNASRSSGQPPLLLSADGENYCSGQSDQSNTAADMSLHLVPSKESIRSNSRSVNTIHSGRSNDDKDKSPGVNQSIRSNRSGRSIKRQMKQKKMEKRREWMMRHKRRRLVVSWHGMCVTNFIAHTVSSFATLPVSTGSIMPYSCLYTVVLLHNDYHNRTVGTKFLGRQIRMVPVLP